MNAATRGQLFLAAVILGGQTAPAAMAATQTTTFQVTATVQAACLINSADTMAFGAYLRKSKSDSTSNVIVTCTNSTGYNVGLDAGTSAGATVTTRKMTGPGGAFLGYSLFSDANRTVNWGNTIGVDTVAGTGNGTPQDLTVYGEIPIGQHPTPGSYNDTITVTLTF
jgi:spore coat protein U-like protein